MIEIDDKIVSADLLRECFACDIAQCKEIGRASCRERV